MLVAGYWLRSLGTTFETIPTVKAVLELRSKLLDQIFAKLGDTVHRVQRLELRGKNRIATIAIVVAILLWLCANFRW
jgi:hypothetical protein